LGLTIPLRKAELSVSRGGTVADRCAVGSMMVAWRMVDEKKRLVQKFVFV